MGFHFGAALVLMLVKHLFQLGLQLLIFGPVVGVLHFNFVHGCLSGVFNPLGVVQELSLAISPLFFFRL